MTNLADSPKEWIALVDCNSFFCSCERLFRPDLINKPVGVLSNNDGCFVARTPELKALGVPMGAPYFKYKDLCREKGVAIFSANFSLYTDLSRRVMQVLSEFSPELEVYSVDEAFLGIRGIRDRDLDNFLKKIKYTVERHVGIPVSIGLARTKVLAKAANQFAKDFRRDIGFLSATSTEDETILLQSLDVGSIWGIGRKQRQKLHSMGIMNARQFRDFSQIKVVQKIFTKVGVEIQAELRGQRCFELNMQPVKKKQIMSSRSFGQKIYEKEPIAEALANFTTIAAEKLRQQSSICSRISVYIRTSPHQESGYYSASEDYDLASPTADTRKMIRSAQQVLENIYAAGHAYQKVAVQLSSLHDQELQQGNLFEPADDERSDRLMNAIDLYHRKSGEMVLKFAACGFKKHAWRARQQNKSPRYLSDWLEIASVK